MENITEKRYTDGRPHLRRFHQASWDAGDALVWLDGMGDDSACGDDGCFADVGHDDGAGADPGASADGDLGELRGCVGLVEVLSAAT